MRVKIIAELCQNHLGDFERVKEMVDKAVEAGATHVKIQHIYTENLTFRPQFEEGLEQDDNTYAIKRPFQPEFERLKGLELEGEHCREFVRYVEDKGAVPLTTCFARGSVEAIRDQGFKAVKVASYDCPSYQMLRELAAEFDEIIVSTGASFPEEIARAAEVLKEHGNYCLLHCVTIYPTPLEELHLARIEWLKKYCEVVGFSDHSLVERDGLLASKAALALGAEVIERHFTILEADQSKDGPVSINPEQLKELVRFASLSRAEQKAELEALRPGLLDLVSGDAGRELSADELLNRDYYRGRFATPRKKGSHLASEMIFNWEETPLWRTR